MGQNASQAIGIACENETNNHDIIGFHLINKLCWVVAWLCSRGYDVECPNHEYCTANSNRYDPLSEKDLGYEIENSTAVNIPQHSDVSIDLMEGACNQNFTKLKDLTTNDTKSPGEDCSLTESSMHSIVLPTSNDWVNENKTLQDEDNMKWKENGWKQLNMLKDYKLPNGADVVAKITYHFDQQQAYDSDDILEYQVEGLLSQERSIGVILLTDVKDKTKTMTNNRHVIEMAVDGTFDRWRLHLATEGSVDKHWLQIAVDGNGTVDKRWSQMVVDGTVDKR
ncbi:unnamed protein product [Mytilus coruscus]|uniref:Mutator-like transposase domain-containing protein n=1 Tax=Mytilus coruscus TaxID=42192 RepID=A0A6J8C1K8_MYTCO|nr:unnamed protein product [Mytilus coruscus]